MSDDDLDRIMAKKLAALQQRAAKPESKTPRDILVSALGYRGLEVLENAERQFPDRTAKAIPRIAAMVSSKELRSVDGGQLLYLLRLMGIYVRMQTSIRVERDGKKLPLSEKLGSSQK